MRTKILLLLAVIISFFPNCTTDYFGFSEDAQFDGTSRSLTPMIYCNKFNENGFNGILISYYNWDTEEFNNNKAYLYLWDVPYEFNHPPTNYIQVHSFSIANNKKNYNRSPVNMQVVPDSSTDNPQNMIITTISHDLLDDIGGITINELTKTHSFVLEDLKGWHGVTLSVFNEKNKPIKISKILIPPFPANPHTYLNNNNREQLLINLHPFENISHAHKSDKIFYDKGLEFCEKSPVPLELPPFNEIESTEDQDPVNEFIRELSLLPE